jgi:hypothetical protein
MDIAIEFNYLGYEVKRGNPHRPCTLHPSPFTLRVLRGYFAGAARAPPPNSSEFPTGFLPFTLHPSPCGYFACTSRVRCRDRGGGARGPVEATETVPDLLDETFGVTSSAEVVIPTASNTAIPENTTTSQPATPSPFEYLNKTHTENRNINDQSVHIEKDRKQGKNP